jgi:hypothetical protein
LRRVSVVTSAGIPARYLGEVLYRDDGAPYLDRIIPSPQSFPLNQGKTLMRAKLLISAAITLIALTPALADEGMWTFDNFPSAGVQQKYGVTIDQPWLDRERAGADKLNFMIAIGEDIAPLPINPPAISAE